MREKMRVLVLAAQRYEAEPSLEILEGSAQLSVEFFELGVGPLMAQRQSLRLPLDVGRVIYLGSCGEFSCSSLPQVRLVTSHKVCWSPSGARSEGADQIEGTDPPITFHNHHRCLKDLESLVNFTSPTITLNPKWLPQQLKADSSDLCRGTENMELYAVSPYLRQVASLILLLGVTNNVGWQSRVQWSMNKEEVAVKSAEFLKSHLSELTQVGGW